MRSVRTRPAPPRTVSRAVGRALVGLPIKGEPKTNATWSKPGTAPYDPDHAGWWAHQSHRRRAAIVWCAVIGTLASVYGWWSSPAATTDAQRVLAWFALIALIYVVIHKTRRWERFKRWIEAIALAAGPMLDMPRRRNPREWVHVPEGHQDDPDKPIVITLPPDFNWPEARRLKLASLVAAVGGIHNFHARFEMDAQPRTLTVSAAPQPPRLVVFSEVIRHWEAAEDDEIVLGLTAGGSPVKRSLGGDSPHILCSMGSGGGKSEMCCNLTLQFRRRGARVIYLDFVKRGASAKWAKDIDGIEVIRRVEPAYEALLDIYDEVQHRCESYWDRGYDPTQQIIFVVLDEANRSIAALKKYEAELRADDKEAPSAIDAIEGILFVGREARTHVLTVGQRMSARASGGGDSREAYGIKLGNRFSPRTARMLFDDVGDGTKASLPRSTNHPGRVQVVSGGTAVEAQGPLLIDRSTKTLLAEPAEFLQGLTGLPAASPRREQVTQHVVRPGKTAEQHTGDTGSRHLAIVPQVINSEPAPTVLVDLTEAAEQLQDRFPGLTVAALRNYRGKKETKGEFPKIAQQKGQTYLYELDAIERFLLNRPRAGSGAS